MRMKKKTFLSEVQFHQLQHRLRVSKGAAAVQMDAAIKQCNTALKGCFQPAAQAAAAVDLAHLLNRHPILLQRAFR
jgi:hypothetical protein